MSRVQSGEVSGDRRSEDRVATVYRPVLIRTAKFAGFCLVRNISPSGMMGQAYTTLAVGTAIQVELGETLTVLGRVAWSRGDMIGISFNMRIEVETVLAGITKRSYRGKPGRAPRLQVRVIGKIIIEDRPIPVAVQDISQKGLKVRSNALKSGDEGAVYLPGMDARKATVRWTHSGMAGLNFFQPIPYDQLGEWVVRQQLGESLADRNHPAFAGPRSIAAA
jgi:hypothetical protein